MSIFTQMRPRRTWIAAAGLALMISGSAAHAADVTPETVVATVGGQDITIGHMVMIRRALPEQYLTLPDDTLFTGILDQLIQQTLLAQAVGTPDQTTQLTIDNEVRALTAGAMIETVMVAATTDEAIAAAYKTNFVDVAPGNEYHAAHILVDTEELVNELAEKLNNGADFAALAKEFSTDGSAPGGGDLGWFGKGMMVTEFEDAVLALQAGQVSPPVKTQFGWHLVKLLEIRTQEVPALEDVRAQLIQQIEDAAVVAKIEELTAAADIKRPDAGAFDPAILKSPDLLP